MVGQAKPIDACPTCESHRHRHPQGILENGVPVDIGGSARDSRHSATESDVKLLAIWGGVNKPRSAAPY